MSAPKESGSSSAGAAPGVVTVTYDDRSVRWFLIAAVAVSLIAMTAGLLAALQLNFWEMNGRFLQWITFGAFKADGVEYLTFGRLRPLHTNAAIFGFVGNMMFAGIYYSTQRLCKARTASDLLTKIHFFGWQLIILAAAITLPIGLTRGKEYGELIWPINIAVALIWVVFAVNFFWTLKKRNEPSLYVALWFYIATIVTVAMLYIVNHLSVPTSLVHSYPIFGGVQDALVQWWYGHNAVAFFLTTPILGIMYYFVPKAAGRPVYSYRLSVIHFWSLVFIYIWAGPHHLLNTALPRWLQMLGMLFSLMLWAPSWGGMLNGLLTLRGAWDKLRTDPVLKFFAAAVTFYGMATFEGPLLSIRAVNELSHYSDWTIGHVHSGTLGWNGFMAAGMFYWMVPRLWGTKLWSVAWANMHFWIGLVGILLYVAAMWVSGITQGLMLNAIDEGGALLKYPDFVETLNAIRNPMLFRALGGGLYLVGFVMMTVNIWKTIRAGKPVDESREVAVTRKSDTDKMGFRGTFANDPFIYTSAAIVFLFLWFFLPKYADVAAMLSFFAVCVMGILAFRRNKEGWFKWYDSLLENYLPFTVLTLTVAAIGGLIQIIPTVAANRAANVEDRLQQLYTPLELAGRDIYIKEGCYNCHSQMIRMIVPDYLRYGDYSRLGESLYDHPFQWGSKRTGPDLAREGGKRPDSWHYDHMKDPRSTSPGSNMPPYPWLFERETDIKSLPKKIAVQRRVGVPYPAMNRDEIEQSAREQAMAITEKLRGEGRSVEPGKEIVAVIAYLQKLGAYVEVDAKGDDTPRPGVIKPALPDETREAATTAQN